MKELMLIIIKAYRSSMNSKSRSQFLMIKMNQLNSKILTYSFNLIIKQPSHQRK